MLTINDILKDQTYDRLYQWEAYRVLKITTKDETYFKVFGSNAGGYLDGDSWRLNSYISKVVYDNKMVAFFGGSGSVYVCPIGEFRMTSYNEGVFNSFLKYGEISVVEYDKMFDVLKEHGIEIEYVGEVV